MNRILDNLYLGTLHDGSTAHLQSKAPIRHIMNCSQYSYHSMLPVLHTPFADEVCLPPWHWDHLVCLLGALCDIGIVLVHCRLGVSRSPVLVAAYLAKRNGYTPWDALREIRVTHPQADPHKDTWQGVLEWWAWHNEKKDQ